MNSGISRIVVMGTLIVALAAMFEPAQAEAGPLVDKVLKASAVAAGEANWAHVRFVHTNFGIETSGLKGTVDSLFDAKKGQFREFIKLGPTKSDDGYDGLAVWQRDSSGQVTLQGGEDAVRGARNTTYQNARGYWHRDKWPARFVALGRRTELGRVYDVLAITPKGGRLFEAWFDSKTHLLMRTVERAATQTNTVIFSDYRRVAGAMVAHAVRQTNGEAKYDTHLQVNTISIQSSEPIRSFSPPPKPKSDFSFLTSEKATTIPFTLINNHMYVRVKLNGQGYEFLLDTGGRNVITPTVARSLGLKTVGAMQGGGVGEKSADFGLTKVARLEVGSAQLRNQDFIVIALESFADVEGHPITGIIGYEVFKRFIVKTDYERCKITLYDPAAFHYSGHGTRVPFTFAETNPVVAGAIDGLKGAFTLDTGSRSSLDLSTPFVKKNDLVNRWGAQFHGVSGWGVGGGAHAAFVRAKSISLGSVKVGNPVVGLSTQRTGSESDIYIVGNVGAGILKKFNIIWDYPHMQIFLETNANFEQVDVFDRAGIWVNLKRPGFVVVDVIVGSPAAAAGLKVGDLIVGVDDKKPETELSLPDFRLRLKEAPGTKIKLDILRASQRSTINLTLKDLL